MFNKKIVNKIQEAIFCLSLYLMYIISHLQPSAVCCSKANNLHTVPLARRHHNYSDRRDSIEKRFSLGKS